MENFLKEIELLKKKLEELKITESKIEDILQDFIKIRTEKLY